MKKYRRKSIGSHVALELSSLIKGRWQIRVLPENTRACSFWLNTIAKFSGSKIIPVKNEFKNDSWLVYHFDSR